MDVHLTAVFRKVPEGFIAFVEELPGANTQGATLDEARANLEEAAALVLETNRALLEEDLKGAEAVPRHREINEFLARKICRDLEVIEP